jgi:hypothetical protein
MEGYNWNAELVNGFSARANLGTLAPEQMRIEQFQPDESRPGTRYLK